MHRNQLPEPILQAITRYGSEQTFDIAPRNVLEDLIAAELTRYQTKLDAVRRTLKRILADGYIDEHSREWERGDGLIAELMSATDGEP